MVFIILYFTNVLKLEDPTVSFITLNRVFTVITVVVIYDSIAHSNVLYQFFMYFSYNFSFPQYACPLFNLKMLGVIKYSLSHSWFVGLQLKKN